ncbi:hypothetical protein PB1_05842 [Bacillus methanolicus PB1]|uniref:Uncharacterized protein n=1 Tax=Bacillus methanolicus PB1 TaxID=997296 RepID=I3E042_BACMT|nr:hypothetical protein PB1_05842 [Bacillus methanolicus PB1]
MDNFKKLLILWIKQSKIVDIVEKLKKTFKISNRFVDKI